MLAEPIHPTVYLVGAGPGDPGLFTLRGKECLEAADFVLYDQLVSDSVLHFCKPGAERVCVRDIPGCHPDRWPIIHGRMIAEARQGKRVVRLKGGDPLIFGRGGEEAEALRDAGIAYEIVPGVTAAVAAAAYLEIPLTHRDQSSAVALVTGHEHPAKEDSRLDWSLLARFPGTLAIYMGMGRMAAIVAELIRHGKDPRTPVAIVSKVSTGEQRSASTVLCDLEATIRAKGLVSPALILIGAVAGLKPELSWFERRPLLNLRVLVTRPKAQAIPFMQHLERLGAVPFHLPTMEIAQPEDWAAVDQVIHEWEQRRYDWLAFTSANGVEAFFGRWRQLGHDARWLGATKIAAIGTSTAESLRRFFLEPDLLPRAGMSSEALLAAWRELATGKRILLAQADVGRELLREELGKIARVDSLVVYRQIEGIDHANPVFDHLRRGEIDIVTLTSPNIARTFLSACDDTILQRLRSGQIRVVSNGPRISTVVKEWGIEGPIVEAAATADGMIAAILKLAESALT